MTKKERKGRQKFWRMKIEKKFREEVKFG